MADIREVAADFVTADTAVVTTTETVAVTSPEIAVPSQTVFAVVFGYATLTTGAATTAVTPRIRRGAAITDTAVGDAIAEEIKAAAGSDEPFFRLVAEPLSGVNKVRYSLTLEQTGASTNGSILQAGILVALL